MKLQSLSIVNFKGIEHFEITDLDETVVIAGPNGCGKSSVLDAIRLLKSAYGGYQPNEFQQWFGEFQINLNRNPGELTKLLRSRDRALVVEAKIVLADTERDFLRENALALVTPLILRQLAPDRGMGQGAAHAAASEFRVHGAQAEQSSEEQTAKIVESVDAPSQTLQLQVDPSGRIGITENVIAETMFQTYDPKHFGVIDYYSAQRQYAREQVGGINLNLESAAENRSQHLLYNPQGKLQNVKTELAASYVSDLIARDAGREVRQGSLQDTLSELFELFFQGKRFLGVQPTESGTPIFPVELEDGSSHDIDDLSSGEKELLYGYLRLRNARARNSVVLLDEPELHLNPRLVRGLPNFYHRHIGSEFGNQIWLITHSDALLRESVGNPGFSVFHMHSGNASPGENQAQPLNSLSEIDQAIVDLVGDLAAYRPGAPILVLESEGERGFDATVVTRLFPELADRINIVSGGSKRRVRELVRLLREAEHAGAVLGGTVHAIIDRDSDPLDAKVDGVETWDVYHIENYLLVEESIEHALVALLGHSPFASLEQLGDALRDSARDTMSDLIVHELRTEVNRSLVGAIDLNFEPKSADIAVALAEAIQRSRERFEMAAEANRESDLQPRITQLQVELDEALESGRWKTEFRGRSVLKRFAGSLQHVRYDHLRNLIIDQFVRDGVQPAGMVATLQRTLPDLFQPE